MAPQKLAVLGSGMASLSAVYWLTSEPGWRDRWDITIYQQGWRLGGKAASGRQRDYFNRSLEHGYHVLLGFYDNTFATMSRCYEEWGRAQGAPLSEFAAPTPEDERLHPDRYAVKRHHRMQVAQTFRGETHYLPFDLPGNALMPGDGTPVDVFTALTLGFDKLMEAASGRLFTIEPEKGAGGEPADHGLLSWMRDEIEHLVQDIDTDVDRWLSEPAPLRLARAVWHELASYRAVGRVVRRAELLVVHLVKAHVKNLWRKLQPTIETNWESYRDWIVQDTMAANLCGILTDDLLRRGFHSINHLNYLDWWMSHAAVPEGARLSAASTLGQLPYDLVFGYRDGDTTSPPGPDKPLRGSPDMEAGTMLIGLFHFLLAYKGAPEWMAQAGFGEILVAPVYEVLKRRGVRIEFFHRVRSLHLDDNHRKVDRIVVERQAKPKSGTYEPLFEVGGLKCWPSKPFYEQLVEGDELIAQDVNLESWWTPWQGPTRDLVCGRDFDQVLIGISIAALPHLCRELIDASPAWSRMVDCIKTNRPTVIEAWFDSSVADQGYPYGTINGDLGRQPINLLTSMSQLIQREGWPPDATPKALIYYSGVFPDDPNEPPAPDAGYPRKEHEAFGEVGANCLQEVSYLYTPNVGRGKDFDWSVLSSPKDPSLTGRDRFRAQYWRVNIDPSERYVLSVTDSSQHRLTAGGTGFDNVFITGDWIQTGLNAGCMEATITAGIEAARAIGGYPKTIPGERSWHGPDAGQRVNPGDQRGE